VALVPKGRAGNRCAIGDRDTMANQKKSWWTRMRTAIKTGDSDTMNELLDSAPAAVTGDEGDLAGGVNLNINVALVPKGRAGNRCAIGDRDTMANQKKSWWTRM
ncbi:hypothetical protein QWO81_24100, partial [Salmonella enterica subsp. enterica serovar Typhimurium]|nr:hypothetical protein [Salmonella enterica subsp. enterica serovar Typhimurium]